MTCALPTSGVFVTRSVSDSSRSLTACTFISFMHSGGGWVIQDTSFISLASSSLEIHVGPFHQRELLASDSEFTPLDARSAGFSTPGIWAHTSVGKSCLISATLWLTNCFHSLFFPWIQNRTFFESVQQRTRLITRHCSSAVLIRAVNLANINSAKSSNLRTFCFFSGETRSFDAINRTLVLVRDCITNYIITQVIRAF